MCEIKRTMNDLIQRSGLTAFVTIILVVSVFRQAQAQKSWTGGGDGASWFDAANWTPMGIPDIDDHTTIDSMDVININPINPGDTAFARSLRINGALKVSLLTGAVLYLDGAGSATTTFELLGDALFSGGGKFIIKGAISDGIKVTSGTLSNGVGAHISILDFANNANGQGLEIESGSFFQNDGNLTKRWRLKL